LERTTKQGGRNCANGSLQSEFVCSEDATSPSAATESIFFPATIEAEEFRDVMMTYLDLSSLR
jgi:hypothetical protein